MLITVLSQPHSEPSNRLGEQLKSILKSDQGAFSRFEAVVAFVKQSGLSRIASELRHFRHRGGFAVACAGIDHKGTSKQGLVALRSLFDEVYIFHDRGGKRTFHPKIYLFESSTKAIVFVGSGNLTMGGLFSNYEVQLRLDLDRSIPDDEQLFLQFKALFEFYRNSRNQQTKRLTTDLLPQLESALLDEFAGSASGVTPDETDEDSDEEAHQATREEAAVDRLFGTATYPDAPPPDQSMRPPRGRANPRRRSPESASTQNVVKGGALGTGFWKLLSSWDVNPESSPGQIQIPIQFKSLFPPLRDSRDPRAPRRGTFQDTEPFSVRFIDGRFSKITNDARYIVYPPGTRPNPEGRFTFRNHVIFSRLASHDILTFRLSSRPGVTFDVERIKPSDPRFQTIRATSRTRWGVLGSES